MDDLREILVDAFHGKHTHVEPIKALNGLTPALARKKPTDETHSCWEVLYHMAYWQDTVLKAYKNEDVSKASNDFSWPKPEEMSNDDDWHTLVERFKAGLAGLVRSAKEEDLKKTAEAWANTPLYYNLIVEIAHNSFHLGQIVAVRKMLGVWPPPEESS